MLSREGIRPDAEKVNAIVNMPLPADKKELQRFLGMVTYLSKFVPDFSTHTDELRQLLKKDIAWHWTDAHENAVQKIKQIVGQNTKLSYFDPEKPATIQTMPHQWALVLV